MSLRRPLVALLWLAPFAARALAGDGPAPAALPPVVGATEVFQLDEPTGLALGGFDPVSYFLPEGPRPGRADLELLWSGAAWRFASAANRAAFKADPASFAPRLGGSDTEALSRGRIASSHPLRYAVVEKRLYLFRTDAGRSRFLEDRTLAAAVEEHWPVLRAGLVQP